ncbi:MAG: 6,7-dimethyl-8-ribityllumazine synthase [Bacteroidia bacterium]
MSTAGQSGSFSPSGLLPKIKEKKFGIVYAQWHEEIINSLVTGAEKILSEFGIPEANITKRSVPGSFELPLGAYYLSKFAKADAVICIGCVVKGETPHFHYICDAVANHIMQLSSVHNKPFIFGVLTVDTMEQATERAGGKHGNKGEEAALAALQMLQLKEELSTPKQGGQLGFSKF